MPTFIGCDMGAVSVKAAVISDDPAIAIAAESSGLFSSLSRRPSALGSARIFLSPYRRVLGDSLRASTLLLDEIFSLLGKDNVSGVQVTGSGGKLLSSRFDFPYQSEFKALSRALGVLYPEAPYLFEIGGAAARFMRLSSNGSGCEAIDDLSNSAGHDSLKDVQFCGFGSNGIGIADYDGNGDCAAGTGAFLDQQATRLLYSIEDVGRIAASAKRAPKIAGRCSVFAKSDMIHAQQKGAEPPDVLKGLCEAVARNFKANIVKGRTIDAKAAFVGGVAMNEGVVQAFEKVFALNGNLIAPEHPAFYGAVGAALIASGQKKTKTTYFFFNLEEIKAQTPTLPRWPALGMEGVRLLREEANRTTLFDAFPTNKTTDAYLGLDIGSVSTNLTCIDADGRLIHEIYLRTQGRPVEAVSKGLAELKEILGGKCAVKGVGATGSGRELIGELIGADAIHDEITAHKTGAYRIADEYLGKPVDTIFEIGGQDSKFISLRDGVVVDFAMNEACAAGTGSFLEEQAEKLGVKIEDEFSRLAFASKQPIRLGERCTVFMEKDISGCQQQGADKEDLIAGLAHAVVQNYLNRVVRGKHVGETIFFQGGTAYNDSVAAAFARILKKPIVVPPHNGVVGAYGAALLAMEKAAALGEPSLFRGFDIEKVDRKTREFTCRECSNHCEIQECVIEGKKTYWGDKCSEKYRREVKVAREPAIPNLIEIREKALFKNHIESFLEGDAGNEFTRLAESSLKAIGKQKPFSVGIPLTLFFYEQLPFWNAYLGALGANVVISGQTNAKLGDAGIEAAVAEPCYPIQVAHGHLLNLLKQDVDHLLVPNVITAQSNDKTTRSYMCPWAQTFPFVAKPSPDIYPNKDKFLTPTVHFSEGRKRVEKELWEVFKKFCASKRIHKIAVALAYKAQECFNKTLETAGSEALLALKKANGDGIILVGRPYNLYDKGLNMNIPQKLRSFYGANVIPLDFLPLDGLDIRNVNPNMFWNYGRKIIQAAMLTSRDPNLHIIYFTNFKCGPDSFVKQFSEEAAVKPYLALQFDGHGNDAGMMTRCEAYLDSKGILRWWSKKVR